MSMNPNGAPVRAVRDTAYYTEEPMTTGEWFWTILLMALPIVGFVLTLVWAFGSSAKVSKRNYARAALIWAIIGVVLSVLITLVAGSSLAMLLGSVNLQ